MTVHIILHKYFIFLILYSIYEVRVAQAEHLPRNENIRFCTTSHEEQKKCQALSSAVQRDTVYRINCTQGANKDDCMTMIDEDMVDLISLDAGEVFIGGRYHSLVPILQETHGNGETYYFAVALVKRGTLAGVRDLSDLRGKKACFAGVGTLAGWCLPIYMLMKFGNMSVYDCNNHINSAVHFFGPSCAVNSLTDKNNPIGDNSDKLCQLCSGRSAGERCTYNDPFADYEGAFKCLVEKGEIAFVKHTTILEVLKKPSGFGSIEENAFQLICLDGSRRPVDDYRNCNWGRVPSNAFVTSSAKTAEQRKFYQKFIKKLSEIYGPHGPHGFNRTRPNSGHYMYNDGGYSDPFGPSATRVNNTGFPAYSEGGFGDPFGLNRTRSNNTELSAYSDGVYGDRSHLSALENLNQRTRQRFRLFQSVPKYGNRRNLMFQDDSTGVTPLEESKQTYSDYLEESVNVILGIRECPVKSMTLCVTSEPEMEKCVKMKIAMKAQLLRPEMMCYKGYSQINCMQAIKNGVADVTVLDAGDVYTAGLNYDLVPFMSEMYNLDTPEYYVVAVTKEEDTDTELTFLRGKYTCHTGINMAAGWVLPLAFLISNGWIRSYGCNSLKSAAEYFTKSCVPGALSAEYNTGVPYDNLCDLCHGTSCRYCRRDASEEYYGHTGAFRCLVEGGGDVAFVKHTTVMENADGKRKEFWARNTFNNEFQLLCPDGTRGKINDYRTCSLGKAKANAIVTRGGERYNISEIDAFTNLFLYTQQFYGLKDSDDFSFSMFSSPAPYSDLIFQDATTQLIVIQPDGHDYTSYLGSDFMRAKEVVDCSSFAYTSRPTLLIILFSILLTLL